MPHSYTKYFRNATLDAYAREATIEAFGHRARWVLDEPDFVDRLPGEMPRPAPESWRPTQPTPASSYPTQSTDGLGIVPSRTLH